MKLILTIILGHISYICNLQAQVINAPTSYIYHCQSCGVFERISVNEPDSITDVIQTNQNIVDTVETVLSVFSYSAARKSSITPKEAHEYLRIYPNPILSEFNIFIEGGLDSEILISIYDLYGRKSEVFPPRMYKENTVLRIPKPFLHSGYYLFHIQTQRKDFYQRVFIL